MNTYEITRIRDAAQELASLVEKGEDYGEAELKVLTKYDIPEEHVNRMIECYATEFAVDDG